jgi:DNA-binding NtrC family response regulator
MISETFTGQHLAFDRLDAISSLTKLLLNEIENIRRSSPTSGSRPDGTARSFNEDVQQFEVSLICDALIESRGNQTQAAKRLGMKNTTLHAKIRKYKIDSVVTIVPTSVRDDADSGSQQTENFSKN